MNKTADLRKMTVEELHAEIRKIAASHTPSMVGGEHEAYRGISQNAARMKPYMDEILRRETAGEVDDDFSYEWGDGE